MSKHLLYQTAPRIVVEKICREVACVGERSGDGVASFSGCARVKRHRVSLAG